MGESAGAMSSFLHLVSPLTQGLFQKIIAFSGSPSTPFLHNDRTPDCYGRAFAKKVLEDQIKGMIISKVIILIGFTLLLCQLLMVEQKT